MKTTDAEPDDASGLLETAWPEAGQLRASKVIKTLWRGQPGTIKLARRYGARLVCVRSTWRIITHQACSTCLHGQLGSNVSPHPIQPSTIP